MRNTSNWTGRTPRSLDEAFGPYGRDHFYEHTPLSKDEDRYVLLACAGALLAVVVMALVGWL